MLNDPNRHRFLEKVDPSDVRLKTERQFMPYEEEFQRPNKQQYNGAGYNLRFQEGHGELIGSDPKYWKYKESGEGMQNTNIGLVETRRIREGAQFPSGLTLYHKRETADDDHHPEERRKYQLVDDHWPKPNEPVKVISDKPRGDGYVPHKPLTMMKPFPDPE